MNPQENPQPDGGQTPHSEPQVIGPQQTQPTQPTSPSEISEAPSAPQPQKIFSSNADEPLAATKRKRPGKKILLAVLAVLLVGASGGAYAYWQILNNSPEKVLADALSNTMKDVLDRKPIQLTGTVKFESHDEQNPLSVAVDLDSKQVGENGEATVKVNVKAGEVYDVTVDAAFVAEESKAFYFKVSNLQKTIDDFMSATPEAPELPEAYLAMIKKLDGQWIKIDEKTLTQFGLKDSEEELDKCTTAVSELRISDDDKTRVREIFKNNQFAIATEELPAEDVDGDSSFHYKLDLNEEASLRFAKDFIELESFSGVKEACEISGEDIDKALDQLKEQTDEEVTNDVKPVFELWVSKKTRYPTKVKITANGKELSIESISTIRIDAKDLNVTIPTDYMTYEDYVDEINQAFASGQSLGWSNIREGIEKSQR